MPSNSGLFATSLLILNTYSAYFIQQCKWILNFSNLYNFKMKKILKNKFHKWKIDEIFFFIEYNLILKSVAKVLFWLKNNFTTFDFAIF